MGSTTSCSAASGLLVVLLLANESAQQVDDLLLSSGGGVEPAAYLGEPIVHLLLKTIEPRGGLLTKRVDRLAVRIHLHAELGYVAISPAGEYPGSRRIPLTAAYPVSQVLDPGLQRGHPSRQIIRHKQAAYRCRRRARPAHDSATVRYNKIGSWPVPWSGADLHC